MKKSRFLCIAFYFFTSNIILFSQTIEEKLYIFNKSIEDNDCVYITKYASEIIDFKQSKKEENLLNSLYLISNCYYEKNEIDSTIKYYEKIVDNKRLLHLDSDTNFIKDLKSLAFLFDKINNTSKVFEINLECLRKFEKLLGKEHPSYLTILNNLGLNYRDLGNYQKALEINLECLRISEKVLGKEHLDYLTSLNNLGLNYRDLGNYPKALEIDLECLRISEKVLGKEHPNYAISLHNIALNYLDLGNYQKALEINLECLRIKDKVLGKEHPDYAISLNSIAANYSNLGDYNKALEYNLLAFKIRDKIQGKEHPDYINTLGNLASIYVQLGDYSKSLEINLQCLKTKEKILGLEHPDYLSTLGNLASIYVQLGDYSKSLEINLQCLKTKEKILGLEHPDYLSTLGNLAGNYSDIENYSIALELNLKCLRTQAKILGVEHPDYLKTLGSLAVNYSELGDYSKALEINLECLKIKEKVLGKEHPSYISTLGNLASNFSNLGNNLKAIELNFECLIIINKLFGIDHPEFISSAARQAFYFIRIGNYTKALELNLECLKNQEKVFGNEHPNCLSTMNSLVVNYIYLGDYKKALELNLKCLKTIENIKGKENEGYLTSLSNVFYSYYYLNKLESADSLLKIQIQILLKYFTKNILRKDLKTQEIFKSKFEDKNLMFTNYAIFRNKSKMKLSYLAFNSWLNLNGIISNQSTQLESQIRASKDSSLIHLFEKWQLNKLQLLKYYELTKLELEKRGINITELEEEINEQERALSRGSDIFSEMKKTYALSDIQQQLKEDEAYVDIVRLPYYNFNTNVWSDTIRYLAYIITKDTKEIPTTVLLENGNQLEEEIASYYAENTFGKTKREKDSISYAYFWKPISSALEGKRKIYLSSGGVYNNINVQTLFNPSTNKYVSEELDVQLLNNGRTFIQQKTKKPQQYTNNTATFIGYPNFNGTLSKGSINEDAIYATTREFSPMLLDTLSRGANVSPLPGTKKEVETIGELLKSKKWNVNVFTENNASEEEIKKVESPRVLHIATHGYFLKQTDKLQKENGLRMMGMDTKRFVENPLLRSGLLLSGANKTLKGDTTKGSENGILTAYEAAYLHLQGTELVVLSACETGKGELKNGEGVYGLRKSFADAGAKNIIMSLWKVDDKVTQEFMTSFYTNWSTGITIREAFNKTQQSIKAMYPQPYYWGAFILVGE